MRPDAPSYVERQADRDLYAALSRGEFCYVLTSRQMGKSSLMIRTAARLREAGVTVAVLDLTALGQNLTPEQWYGGLLGHLGAQVDLEDELDEYWLKHSQLGPLQRWMRALREVVLPAVGGSGARGQGSGEESISAGPRPPAPGPRLVLFLDEIDAVRSLPFSTDEFFAGIRECHNRRAEDPEFERLTFCLLGVATPSDLIQDVRTTPFNIGRRIELTDFTETEALPLAWGLERWALGLEPGAPDLEHRASTKGPDTQRLMPNASRRPTPNAQRLLSRILYWTGGHPYLTQRLCRAVAEAAGSGPNPTPTHPHTHTPTQVDQLCTELFLSPRARERDDNLMFVRERLLRFQADTAALLELYDRIWRGRRVPNDETNPLVSLLRLSGIVRLQNTEGETRDPRAAFRGPQTGVLRVRNRIYQRVFNRQWVRQHMPDAELRRQRAAYQRGLARAGMLSLGVIGVVGALAWTALRSADDRRRALIEVRSERDRGGDLLYASQMNLSHLAYKDGRIGRARRLLEEHLPRPGQRDRRDFVWRLLWRVCRSQDRTTLPPREGEVTSTAFSRDGKVLASGGTDGAVQLRDTASNSLLATVPAHRGGTLVTFSPDGRLLATAGIEDGTVRLWDLTSRPVALRREFPGFRRQWTRIVFTPDGKTLIAGSTDDRIRLWDLGTGGQALPAGSSGNRWRSIPIHAGGPLALSPDGSTLAVCAAGKDASRITLWNIASRGVRRLPVSLPPEGGIAQCVAFSPDGRLLVTGTATPILWNAATGRLLRKLSGDQGAVCSAAFSPDRPGGTQLLAAGGIDGTIRLWDPASGRPIATLEGHTARVLSVAFSPRGETLASASSDGTTRLWDTDPGRLREAERERSETQILTTGSDGVGGVAFSPDGTVVAAVRSRSVTFWSVGTGTSIGPPLLEPPGSGAGLVRLPRGLAFSPDGKRVATGSPDGAVRLWDIAGRRVIATLRGHPFGVSHVGFAAGGVLVTGNGGAASGVVPSIRLWDVSSRQLLGTPLLSEPGTPVGVFALSPDGKILATGSLDHRVTLWSVPVPPAGKDEGGRRKDEQGTGPLHPSAFRLHPSRHPSSFALHPSRLALLDGKVMLASLAFSPDGRWVAAGERDWSVTLWDRTTGRQTRRLVGHVGPVLALAFSPDSRTLATGAMDGTVRLWNPDVDQEEATLTGHTDWVWALAFSPDGNTLASGSPDGTVRLWRAAPITENDGRQP